MKLRYLQLRKNSSFEESFESMHCIVFILQGTASIKSHVNKEYILRKREMVFCPMSTSFKCTLKEETKMMLVSFSDVTDHASVTFVNTLRPVTNSTPTRYPYILEIKPILDGFFEFIELIHDTPWLQDPVMMERIMGGIFYLYTTIYSPAENSLFFSPLVSSEYDFRNRVLRHHLTAKNTQELAKLCGYTYYTFNRMFIKEFNVTPYRWIIEERKKRILMELENPTVPIKNIVSTFHFSSPAHLTKFCRQHFGQTARDIRKKTQKRRYL